MVATSHDQMGDFNKTTGLWLDSLAVPYYIFKFADAIITLASPLGGEVPLDPKSESIIMSSSTTRKFNKDPEAISLLSDSAPLDSLRAKDFDMLFLTGGHGSMWDFPKNAALRQLVEDFHHQGKPIGAVGHGVSGLINAENENGTPLLKARKVTAFSNTEEQASGLTAIVPLLLETTLVSMGAVYSKTADFISHVVIDGQLVTGQNPVSSIEVARKLLGLMKDSPKKTAVEVY